MTTSTIGAKYPEVLHTTAFTAPEIAAPLKTEEEANVKFCKMAVQTNASKSGV